MRNGVLIEEGTPKEILDKYGSDTLEEAFLALCRKQIKNKVFLRFILIQF